MIIAGAVAGAPVGFGLIGGAAIGVAGVGAALGAIPYSRAVQEQKKREHG